MPATWWALSRHQPSSFMASLCSCITQLSPGADGRFPGPSTVSPREALLCSAFGEIWHSCYLTGEKFRINLGRSPGNSLAQEVVCVPLPQEPPEWSPRLFFFWKLFLIVIECSTAYSKYHSYKFLASIFQSDHYLIFKTKQNKNSKNPNNKTRFTLHTHKRGHGAFQSLHSRLF